MNAPLEQAPTLPITVYWVWILALAEATLIVLPLTIYSRRQSLKTARRAQRNLKEMAEAGTRIRVNAGNLKRFNETVDIKPLLKLAESLRERPMEIEKANRSSPSWQRRK